MDRSIARPDLGDTTIPFAIGFARRDILLQEVWGDVEEMIAVGRALELAAARHLNAVLLHDPGNARSPTRRPASLNSSVIRGLQ